ncbi:MAG: protein kinase [Phycisphaerales bacterium]|nr:protein kinase [Phycisphaerales bacterium]
MQVQRIRASRQTYRYWFKALGSMTDSHHDSHEQQIDAALREAVAAKKRAADWVAGRSTVRSTTGHSGLALGEAPALPGFVQLKEIQRGGQGVVFRAVQTSTGRTVAIKLIRGGALASAADRARFEREVRILAQLKHPNIVPIYDSGQSGGWNYFVMDFIDGATLEEYVASARMDMRGVVSLVARVSEAIEAAHLRGIIHRDLKPANIRVDSAGVPHVLDFGLAKQSEIDDEARDQTQTGQFVGSLPWASPEQVTRGAADVDMRSDVYSLGVILYRLLTGEHPYPLEGGVRTLIERIESASPSPPRTLNAEIDDELEAVALKCLAKEPERRYQSAGELARELRCYLAGEAISAKRDSGWYVLRKQFRRHRGSLLVGLGFVALLAASAIVAWSLYLSSRSRLWDSLVAQARAGRYSDRIGRRVQSLAAIAAARDIRNDPLLRDEAAACLALSDLRLVRELDDAPVAFAMGLRTIDRVAVLNPGGGITVRAMYDGAVIANLEAPGGLASRLMFSPDGRYLSARYTFERAATCVVWDIATATKLLEIHGPAGGGLGICSFAHDQAETAAIEGDGSVTIHSLDQSAPPLSVRPDFPVTELAYGPDGTQLALASYWAGRVAIWDIEQGCVLRELPVASNPMSVAWSRDGQKIVAGGEDHNIRVFELLTDAPPRDLHGHNAQVVTLAFGATSDRLFSWGWESQTWIWDLTCGREWIQPLVGGRMIGAADRMAHWYDGRVRLWEAVDVSVMREFDLGESMTARRGQFIGDGDRFLSNISNGAGVIRDARSGGSLAKLAARNLRSIVAPPNSPHVYAVSNGRVLHGRLDVSDSTTGLTPMHIVPMPYAAHDIGISADGRRLIVAGTQQVFVKDLETDAVLFERSVAPGGVNPSISADGHWAFVGNWKGTQHRAILMRLDGGASHEFEGEHVEGRVAPRGDRAAVCTPDSVEVWDLARDAARFRIPREPAQPMAGPMAFSPNGRILAIAKSAYDVQLVSAEDGRVLVRLPNPRLNVIVDLDFSPDGRYLLVITPSPHQFIWDLQELRRELRGMRLDWED